MSYTVYSQNLAVYGQDNRFHSTLVATYGYHDRIAIPDIRIPNYVERALDLLIEQFERPLVLWQEENL
jgi:hypothetical protein